VDWGNFVTLGYVMIISEGDLVLQINDISPLNISETCHLFGFFVTQQLLLTVRRSRLHKM